VGCRAPTGATCGAHTRLSTVMDLAGPGALVNGVSHAVRAPGTALKHATYVRAPRGVTVISNKNTSTLMRALTFVRIEILNKVAERVIEGMYLLDPDKRNSTTTRFVVRRASTAQNVCSG